MNKFKRHRDYGFGNQNIRLSKLSALGDPLEKLNEGLDVDMFRGLLEDRLSKVRAFRESLTDMGLAEELFALFLEELDRLNLTVNEGKIIDAGFVEVPRRHVRSSEEARIREGGRSKLITKYPATPPEVHDSRATENLLEEKDRRADLYADSACADGEQSAVIKSRDYCVLT